MRALLLTAVLSSVTTVTLATDFGGDMEAARNQSVQDGRPMFLLVGATWCQACHQVYDPAWTAEQRATSPVLGRLLRSGHFVYWDADARKDEIKRYQLGGVLPCLTVLVKTADGWKQKSFHGLGEITRYVNN